MIPKKISLIFYVKILFWFFSSIKEIEFSATHFIFGRAHPLPPGCISFAWIKMASGYRGRSSPKPSSMTGLQKELIQVLFLKEVKCIDCFTRITPKCLEIFMLRLFWIPSKACKIRDEINLILPILILFSLLFDTFINYINLISKLQSMVETCISIVFMLVLISTLRITFMILFEKIKINTEFV